ncbi:glycoside hydrolase family 13 protein [Periweissella cryptocerci]|uniref:Glycoside hydrolase family 13 protein n=1 Tax=Periweissella cryptocerci TaxID=2506420 RepID=A0A4P6YUE7_9LACO|nr:glycoside hydrolase family 13 protein [Periweissella cryptocerci]QBO36360.1 glycoside hydrolase family 13 protein [Periweissella cryptocerci]
MAIYFDPLKIEYKKPFGAVLYGTTIDFGIKIEHEQVHSVTLNVIEDQRYAPKQVVEFQPNKSNHWIGQFTANNAGLYFYYYEITLQDRTIYYGAKESGMSGSGQWYNNLDEVHSYQLTTVSKIEKVPDWYKNAIFYHIFVDRFNNGNPDGKVTAPKPNTFLYGQMSDAPMYIRGVDNEIARWDFYGGNFKGITQKLEYLQNLGVTALYLSPVFESRSNHRYDTADYLQIDSMLGSLADFDALLAACHQRGMHVILDGVFNHVGSNSRYFNLYGTYEDLGGAESENSPYFSWFDFSEFPTEYNSWWGVKDLPVVNKNDDAYQKFIYKTPQTSVIDYWTKRGVDGWRLDVADELPDNFIKGIRTALDRAGKDGETVLIGEVWEDASNKIAYGERHYYLNGDMLHAVMNYPFRSLMLKLLNGEISIMDFVLHVKTLQEHYPSWTFKHNFNNIGTHDTERALTMVGKSMDKFNLLVQMFMTLPGVPCIYYGDETGLTGGKDPENRAFYPWDDVNPEAMNIYQDAIAMRKKYSWLVDASFDMFPLGRGVGYMYYHENGQYVIFAVNPTDMTQTFTSGQADTSSMALWPERLVEMYLNDVVVKPYSMVAIDNS